MPERYEDMSDAELIAELRAHLPDRSWTLGQMAELEQRGFDSIASDEELHAAVIEDYEAWQEKIRKAFAPALERLQVVTGLTDRWKDLSKELGAAMAPRIASAFGPLASKPPTALEIEAFGPPSWEGLHVTEPDFDPIVDRLAADADRLAEQEERLLAVQVEQLETLKELRTEAARWNEHDWFDWIVLVAVIVAAVAGLGALLLA